MTWKLETFKSPWKTDFWARSRSRKEWRECIANNSHSKFLNAMLKFHRHRLWKVKLTMDWLPIRKPNKQSESDIRGDLFLALYFCYFESNCWEFRNECHLQGFCAATVDKNVNAYNAAVLGNWKIERLHRSCDSGRRRRRSEQSFHFNCHCICRCNLHFKHSSVRAIKCP